LLRLKITNHPSGIGEAVLSCSALAARIDARQSAGYSSGVNGLSLRLELLGVALLSSVFLLLVLMDSQYVFIPSEGVFNDQYLAVRLLEQLQGPQDSLWRAFMEGRLPAGREAPSYHGLFMAYFYMPFHYVFGASWNLARYWCLLLALCSLGFTYGFMRRVYGPAAALAALFLIVIHPGYVMMIRTGSAFYSPMHFFSCGCLYFASLWWDTRRHVFFGVALALIGLGLSTMLWFGWFVAGRSVATLLLCRATFVRMRLRDWKSSLRLALAAPVGLLAGSVLLIYREWNGESDLLGAVSSDVGSGFDVYLANVPSVWATVTDTWWSFSANAWFGSNPAANTLYPRAVVVAIGVVAVLALWDSEGQPRLLLPVVFAVMLVQVPLALRAMETALFFLYPFPQMVLAAAAIGALRGLSGRKAFVPLLAVLMLFLAAELRSMASSVSLQWDRVEQGAHLGPVSYFLEWLRQEHSPEQPLFLNKGDALEPYIYFSQPERGVLFSAVSAEEVLLMLNSEPAGGGADWTFVYGVPGPRPEILAAEYQPEGTRVEIVAEFSHDRSGSSFRW